MFGLSFLAPLYLLAALAVALPIALHLFRRRTDIVVDFPAVQLLHVTPVQQQRRRRLRELILLALRVTALVLLAAAFARPYLVGAVAADAPLTVVALDTSFSLSSPAVFTRAKAAAAAALREAPGGHAVALLTFADSATTVVPPTIDREGAVASLAAIVPSASATRYASAMARASELLGAREGRVVVVTDLQRDGWNATSGADLPEDVTVEVLAVDAPLHNVAVTDVVRRGDGVEADLYNFGLDAQSVTARLHVIAAQDGTTAGARVAGADALPPFSAEVTVAVAPRGVAHVRFDAAVPRAGAVAVSVDDEEGFVADNVRFAVLDPAAPVRVAVVVADPTSLRGGLYVERALQAAGEDRRFDVTVVDGRALSAWTPEQVRAQDALIVLGTRTLERRGREAVAAYLDLGGSALVAAGPDIDPATLDDVLGEVPGVSAEVGTFRPPAATLVVGDTRHPVFRVFAEPASSLGDVPFERYRTVEEDGRSVLARFSGGAAALVEVPRRQGRLLLFASDLDNQWNRFPLSPAFVPFMVEAVGYLSQDRQTRQAFVLPAAPPGIEPVPGIVMAPARGGEDTAEPVRVALNVDVRESNPAPMTAEAFVEAVPRASRTRVADPEIQARQAEDEQRLWRIGLLVMFVALAGEGLIGRRAT